MYRWKDNNRIDLREIEREGIYWIHLARVRDQCWALVHTVMKLLVP
jgi:hypothetical protein